MTRNRHSPSVQTLTIVTLTLYGLVALVLYNIANSTEESQKEVLAPLSSRFSLPWSPSTSSQGKKKAFYQSNDDIKRLRNDSTDERIEYTSLREEYEKKFPSSDTKRLLEFVQSLRKHSYEPIASMPYDVYNCPLNPPDDYPQSWNIQDVISNWNPDDTNRRQQIYIGLCIFDYETEIVKAQNYQKAELPFVLRNDPNVLPTVARWSDTEYLRRFFKNGKFKTELSSNNHFMFSRVQENDKKPKGWVKPLDEVKMTFMQWLHHADNENVKIDDPHYYFRLSGCVPGMKCEKKGGVSNLINEELPFFKPTKSIYIVDPSEHRGINCRFGMTGVIAENHFDGSRNMIALLGGERRYILAHPNQCKNLALYPRDHPSGRHSAVDWSDPDFNAFPQFKNAMVNEVVLQAGDLLYLPTFWFHYIVSLELNYQCNTRSGVDRQYTKFMTDCGF